MCDSIEGTCPCDEKFKKFVDELDESDEFMKENDVKSAFESISEPFEFSKEVMGRPVLANLIRDTTFNFTPVSEEEEEADRKAYGERMERQINKDMLKDIRANSKEIIAKNSLFKVFGLYLKDIWLNFRHNAYLKSTVNDLPIFERDFKRVRFHASEKTWNTVRSLERSGCVGNPWEIGLVDRIIANLSPDVLSELRERLNKLDYLD